MPRLPIPVGSFGAVTRLQRPDGSWSARTYVRDLDGERRLVSRRGRSGAAAERALKAAWPNAPHPPATRSPHDPADRGGGALVLRDPGRGRGRRQVPQHRAPLPPLPRPPHPSRRRRSTAGRGRRRPARRVHLRRTDPQRLRRGKGLPQRALGNHGTRRPPRCDPREPRPRHRTRARRPTRRQGPQPQPGRVPTMDRPARGRPDRGATRPARPHPLVPRHRCADRRSHRRRLERDRHGPRHPSRSTTRSSD